MKTLIAAVALLASVSSFAATTIKFNLVGFSYPNNNYTEYKLSSFNSKLVAKGLPTFPESVELSAKDGKAWTKIVKQFEAAKKALKLDENMSLYGDRINIYELEEVKVCYKGDTAGVPDVIFGLMKTVFHEEQGIQAIRFKDKKFIYSTEYFFENNAEAREFQEEENPASVEMWDKYKKTSDVVLVMSDFGPQGDGTELKTTQIKRCR